MALYNDAVADIASGKIGRWLPGEPDRLFGQALGQVGLNEHLYVLGFTGEHYVAMHIGTLQEYNDFRARSFMEYDFYALPADVHRRSHR